MIHHMDLNLINARRRELEAEAARHRLARDARSARRAHRATVRASVPRRRASLRHRLSVPRSPARDGKASGVDIDARDRDVHRTTPPDAIDARTVGATMS